MHVNQKPRRRHSEEFKAQVLAACAAPGASVSAVALSFGLNDNLVHQWRRGRGHKASRAAAADSALPHFVALSLPAPVAAAAAVATDVLDPIRVEFRRGALSVSVSWPLAASSQCAAWLRELLR
jgi:transposase